MNIYYVLFYILITSIIVFNVYPTVSYSVTFNYYVF